MLKYNLFEKEERLRNELIEFKIDNLKECEIKNISGKKIELIEIDITDYDVNNFRVQVVVRGQGNTPSWFVNPKTSPLQKDVSEAKFYDSIPIRVQNNSKVYLKLVPKSCKSKEFIEAKVYYKIH